MSENTEGNEFLTKLAMIADASQVLVKGKMTIVFQIENPDFSEIYMMSKLKNKFILQEDDNYNLFSLKNEYDADRLLDLFQEIKIGSKLIIVKDVSSPQRKYLYELLVSRGYNKKFLYASYTTYPT